MRRAPVASGLPALAPVWNTPISKLTPSPRALARRIQAHYFLLFAPFAIALTYQNLHFRRLGFSDAQIGFLNAIAAILTVVSPPLWGYVSDGVRDKRIPLGVLLLLSGALYPSFAFAHSLGAAAACQAAFYFFMAPCIALTDAMVLGQLKEAGGDYARLRLWGSLGFIGITLIFGLVLGGGPLAHSRAGSSLAITFAAFAVIRVAGTLWLLSLPACGTEVRTTGYSGDLLGLLRDRAFLLFLLAAFLSMTAFRSYYVFFSIFLDGLHVADSLKGIFWSVGVLSEVVFMLAARRVLKRIGVRWALALGMAGGAVRLLLFSFPVPALLVACAQALHALAFGATHIASMTFISHRVPARLSASGQTLYAAITGGVAGAAGSALAGCLAQAYSIAAAFRASAALAAAAAVLCLLLPEPPAD